MGRRLANRDILYREPNPLDLLIQDPLRLIIRTDEGGKQFSPPCRAPTDVIRHAPNRLTHTHAYGPDLSRRLFKVCSK
jgi:hypothetical protein